MSHSITKIWIHGVFSTKDRANLIKDEFRDLLYKHIFDILVKKFNCFVKAINGTQDHLHILFLLNHNHSIQEIFHYIKGESSHWINQNDFLNTKFAWQIGYGAFSVGESGLENIEKYILNQEEHHKTRTFNEEYNLFLNKYKIDLGNR